MIFHISDKDSQCYIMKIEENEELGNWQVWFGDSKNTLCFFPFNDIFSKRVR